jgi:putative flippase GtrA
MIRDARGVRDQLIRYAMAGGASALIYSAIYLFLADYVLPRGWAVAAVPPAFFAAAGIGFFLHSGWSFRGHGTREPGQRQRLRFLIVQGAGLAMNAAFTWTLTGLLHQPNWLALVPCGVVTPLATFWLQRQWVFR